MSKANYNEVIESLVNEGTEKDAIVVVLFQDHALSLNKANSIVNKYFKDNGLTNRAGGFTADFYTFLLEASPAKPRTEKDIEKYLNDNGSQNVLNHSKHYQAIGALVAKAFEKGSK